jgi:hypothetical protein
VAATRAKRRLFVSGAYWYGLPEPRSTPAEPSALFELVEGHEVTVNAGHAEVGTRPDILRAPDATAAPDPLFEGGWQAGLRMAMNDPEEIDRIAAAGGVTDEYRRLASDWDRRLFELEDLDALEPSAQTSSVSVTGLVTYAQCPKRFYWSDVDRLPRRRNEAATRGSELHRRIELHQRGQIPFEDLEPDLYDTVESDGGEPGGYVAYEDSRFAAEKARFVEAPFVARLDNGYTVKGRIDAIYADESHWEVVDFKSGRPSEDPSRMVQLEAYAVAVNEVDFGAPKPDSVDVTFAYFGGGLREVTAHADPAWVDEARAHIIALTDAIDAGEFAESPGQWCHNCDFLQFCGPGQAEVSD